MYRTSSLCKMWYFLLAFLRHFFPNAFLSVGLSRLCTKRTSSLHRSNQYIWPETLFHPSCERSGNIHHHHHRNQREVSKDQELAAIKKATVYGKCWLFCVIYIVHLSLLLGESICFLRQRLTPKIWGSLRMGKGYR